MADELTLESLEGMGKADYVKAFKNKAVWKKAKAAIFLVDYKLDGKKTVIALPFKKESEMKAKMKEIKKTKKHVLKKTGGGLITVENDGPEGLKAKVELLLGGLNPFILQDKALELFARINATLEVKLAEGAELETDESEDNISTGETETDVNSKTTDDDVNSSHEDEVVNNNGQPKSEDKNKEIKLIIAKIVKMNQTINLKNGLDDTELKTAEDIKSAIREFAKLLKTADASARAEYGETFLKTKKLYAKIEEEIKKLKELDKELESELNDALGIGVNPNNKENEEEEAETDDESDEEEDDEEPTTQKEAIAKSKELMDEINDLIKSVKLFEMA
jgi:hypothetical protein